MGRPEDPPASSASGDAVACGRANPKEASVRAVDASVSCTLDHYGRLLPQGDEALRTRLDAFHVAGGPDPGGRVVELPR
jgi:hypothetical protein